MTLPTSGPISLGDAATELQRNAPITLGDAAVRGLASKSAGTIALGDIYGADQIEYTLAAGASGATVGYQSGSFGTLTPDTLLGASIVSVLTEAGLTPLPVPANQVLLSTYGGVPGASATTIINAFSSAFTQLKALGGGTLVVGAGTYDFGNTSVAATLIGVSDLSNVLIEGTGAVFKQNTTAAVIQAVFHFLRPSNVTLRGMKFTDTGFDPNVNWKGGCFVRLTSDAPRSNFRMIECETDGAVQLFSAQDNVPIQMSNIEVRNCTVRNSYYGFNCTEVGSGLIVDITCENVRRAAITYHIHDAVIRINGSHTNASYPGSNGYVALTHDGSGSNLSNVSVTVNFTGMYAHAALVHFYHQGPNVAGWYDTITAKISLTNVSGGSGYALYRFDHEATGILSTTLRSWKNIKIDAAITGTYAGSLISSPTTSTAVGNSIVLGSGLSAVSLASLQSYFSMGSVPAPSQPSSAVSKLIVKLNGTYTPDNGFRAVLVNGTVYDPTDSNYFSVSGGFTTWEWWNNVTPIASNAQVPIRFIVGPDSLNYNGPVSGGNLPFGGGTDWTLTFEDNFTGTSLDTSKWNDAIWYESPDAVANYSVSGGSLKIWPMSNWANRTIDTDGKFSQQYGFFEMRAKLPIGKGLAPAFWLYYHGNDTDQPTIDVMKTYCGATSGSTVGAATLIVNCFGEDAFAGQDGASTSGTQVATPIPSYFGFNIDARYTIDNEGFIGMTMERQWSGWAGQGVPSWSSYYPGVASDIVILNNCINDADEALGTANYSQRIRDLVGSIRARGKYAILQTPHETSNTAVDAYRTAMLSVASELGVQVIDVYTYTRNYRISNGVALTTLCPDGKWPNQAHHQRIGEYMATRFNEIIAADSSAPKLQSTTLGFANSQFHPVNYGGTAYSNAGAWIGDVRLPDTISLTYSIDSVTNIDNPERGFITMIELNGLSGGSALTPWPTSYFENERATTGRTLYVLALYLNDSIASTTLNPTLISRAATQLANMRAAGVKCVIRGSYNQDGGTADAPLNIALAHIDALASTLQTYSDVIFCVQAGMIGPWGEWWQSANYGSINQALGERMGLSDQNWADRKAIVDKWLAVLPSHISVAVRMPAYKRNMYGSTAITDSEAFGAGDRARVSHHNDAFVSSDTDMGTYLTNTQAEYPYLVQETMYAPIGGESAAYVSPRGDASSAETELALFHYSYLNEFYHQDVIDAWTAAGRLEVIRKKLGYRLALVSAELPSQIAPGALMSLTLTIRNDGYAAPMKARPVNLILRNTTSGAVTSITLPLEIRRWLPGADRREIVSVSIPSNLPLGTYSVALHLPDPSSALSADARAAIRLANFGVWEATTGYNLLGHSVTAVSALGYVNPATDLSSAFHIYGMKWEANGNVTWYFDGKPVGAAVATGGAITHALYPVLSLWYGGISGTPNTTDTPTGSSNAYEIDYVKVWAKPGSTGGGGGGGGGGTPTGEKIEFYGNSTLRGYNGTGYYTTTPVQVFAAAMPTYTVANEAVNSSRADLLLYGIDGVHPPFDTQMTNSTAKYVVLGFGSLDQYTYTPQQFKDQYAAMFPIIRAHGKIPVVMTPFINSASGTATMAQAARDIAATWSVPVLDVFAFTSSWVASRTSNVLTYVPDGVHPNVELFTAAAQWMASVWNTIVINGNTGGGGATGVYPVGQGTTGWTLTFNEEFDGTFLDPSRWNQSIWYESIPAVNNYRVANGQLDIWPALDGNNQFFFRTLDTDGKFYQTYGYFEAEMKLPVGRGCWPAFWLYNHDVGDERPEIDIMEAYSGGNDLAPQPGWADNNNHPITAQMTVHYPVPGGDHALAGTYKSGDFMGHMDLSAAFHVYGVKWEPSGTTFYFDGQQVGAKITNQAAAMNRRMYILLDLWYGSASQNPTIAETPTGPSNSFSIKYVRAWQFA